ncbi:hypothetical protein [Catellatospora sichuanensis]|uniref:hypothetical protein n=1 Tax=Catellatospora sichuanensis TaxID=1969805 RepID=UPI001182F812|nr:hypothetical protein [Catellatospora sichuanensis]
MRHQFTLGERIVLETGAVQRMARLRQTGLAYLTIPTNENSRLPHCMGTAYWTARFIDAMRVNDYAEHVGDGYHDIDGNRERLAHLEALLGPDLSLDLLARLYALVHDSDLLPFGHTLSYQLGFYPPPGNIARFAKYVRVIAEQVTDSPLLAAIEDEAERAQTLAALHRHLDAAEAVATSVNLLSGKPGGHSTQSDAEVARLLPVYTFVETLVTATVSTDLLDFSLRDTLGASTPWQFDAELLRSVCVFATPPAGREPALLAGVADPTGRPVDMLFRFGVSAVGDGRVNHRAVTYVVDLLRVRYEVLERIVYSPGKCAADAMLDRGIRNINSHHAGEPFPEPELLALGDDQFLDYLEADELKVNLPPDCRPVMGELKARRLWREAYRLEDRSRLSEPAVELLRPAKEPSQRDLIEERLLKELPGVPPSEIVVSCLPLNMQMKDPDVLIGWADGAVLPLGELAATTGYAEEALGITKRYSSLWSLSVYTRAVTSAQLEAVRKAATALFEN